jgi:hypothetical protein
MGNRAILQFKDNKYLPSIYLHWSGGRASVEAFLDVAKRLNFRSDSYGIARLSQIIGNYFGGSLSLGVENEVFNVGDNGIYVIKDFNIINRLKCDISEEIDKDKTKHISDFIIDMMERLGVIREKMYQEEKYK